jgi:hypothetical protein
VRIRKKGVGKFGSLEVGKSHCDSRFTIPMFDAILFNEWDDLLQWVETQAIVVQDETVELVEVFQKTL